MAGEKTTDRIRVPFRKQGRKCPTGTGVGMFFSLPFPAADGYSTIQRIQNPDPDIHVF
jgi:hypothetical protein